MARFRFRTSVARLISVPALQRRLVQMPRDEASRTVRAAGLQDTSAAVADFGSV
jgi:hypothetical protein